MQATKFECQIAQAQISRYLAGDDMGSDTVQQLNEHIGGCVTCKAALAERRAALQDQLSQKPKPRPTPQAVISVPANTAEDAGVAEETPSNQNWIKPLLYSGGLGAVLIAMSLVANNPTGLLGKRASETALASSGNAKAATTPPAVSEPVKNADFRLTDPVASLVEAGNPVIGIDLSRRAPTEAELAVITGRKAVQDYDLRPRASQQPESRVDRPERTTPRTRLARSGAASSSLPAPASVVVYDNDGNKISP